MFALSTVPARMTVLTVVLSSQRWTNMDELFASVVGLTIQLHGDGFAPRSIVTWSASITRNVSCILCDVLALKGAVVLRELPGKRRLRRLLSDGTISLLNREQSAFYPIAMLERLAWSMVLLPTVDSGIA